MQIQRYTAFSADPQGGNPAGVVLDATGVEDAAMLAAAAEVGYSETAFLIPRGPGELDVRYFSPLAEVPFCGHATIAAAVAYAHANGPGTFRLATLAGPVEVSTEIHDGQVTATLVSVEPRSVEIGDDDLAALLAALRWDSADLDPALPVRVAYAGAWHPVVAASTRARLAELDYDFDLLAGLMAARDWTTIELVWRESETVFHARDPFPPGGVVEDPVTGAAAAAFGGYLRELGLIEPPATLTVHQGEDMGRPGVITLKVPLTGGISVTGTAVPIPDPA
ncbi:phenazine biosynthesis protein PhzF family [Actinokineospora alba]|uniref:Phenazine biosynthesis protein PhzF family n=1 Tax=Actinokineospora alba TaxID=504798 RepID=A0A1H0UD05_9PSEU|nr:PhzF family phenazine biosynthesis isomerase [Actinokineospora alba]TDP65201.1 PhzF family phenazine biosynthesis protein [Actinokineospora alba]SDH56521.1 phenazine biosynthesis protein PhzF family [Actinokineospora alba]SDP63746.1 phenazine biosynthesis protein PhzF family [Actinokineospora alba]